MLRHSRAHTRAARARAIAKAKRTAAAQGQFCRANGLPLDLPPRPWGRWAKRRYMDCGRPRCGLCACHKVPKRIVTIQECRQALRALD